MCQGAGNRLSPRDSRPLHGELYGRGSGDTLRGSSSEASHYSETLYGNQGADTLNGGQGDDTLVAGLGADTVNGGPGDDVLIVQSAGDEAYGGLGNDVLCATSKADALLHGGQGANTLYISKNASGSPDPLSDIGYIGTCGHSTTWGTGWAGADCLGMSPPVESCCWYNQSSAPAACQPWITE